ncbi:DUF2256 domain-containing protein [Hyphomonas atlantica]|uniref:DUF2256 domain-containing protein n=2 Tax=Hyphomonas atlantica TaxID=1280948 RepID=UPI0023F320A6|nr:DUF2256 domain-containing protein [Hyphomonas atlantica]
MKRGGGASDMSRPGSKPKRVSKADLPEKTCAVCNRPFSWRKKWARVWEDVKYCSERCRRDALKR